MQPKPAITTRFRHHAMVMVAAALYGLITVAGRYFADAGLSLYEISLLIIFVPLPLLPLVVARQKYRIRREQLGFYAVFGLIGAGLQVTQFAGIVLGVPVAVVALLLYTQPLWTIIFGKLLLSEEIGVRKLGAAALAVLGIVFLLNPFHAGDLSPVGLAAACLGGMFLSLWVIWGRKSGLMREHFVTTTFGYATFSALWLLLLFPLNHFFFPGHTDFARLDFSSYAAHLPAVAGFAVFAGALPACLAFFGMRSVDASTAGILLLFEPVSAALLALLLFGQPLTANIWLGGGLIISANAVLLSNTGK